MRETLIKKNEEMCVHEGGTERKWNSERYRREGIARVKPDNRSCGDYFKSPLLNAH